MAGELFQSERGQIKAVEAQAEREKKDQVKTELQGKKDLLHTEVSKAGKLLADAEAKVSLPASKEKVSGYKKDISSTLKDIVNSGQQALKAENPDADLAVLDMLAGSLKQTIGNVKEYVPLFQDVEAGKTMAIKMEDKLKIARDKKKKNGVGSQEFNKALMDVDDVLGKTKESEIYLWKPEALPADMQAILMSVLGPLKEQEAEVAGYRLERTQDSALEDGPTDLIEGKEHKAAMRILKPAKAAFDAVQPNMEKISTTVKTSKDKPESLADIGGTVDTAITDLGAVLKQFKAIDKSKFVDPEVTNLYEVTLQKIQIQLSDLASLKVSLKTRELMTNGLTDEEKKYVTMDEKGNIMKTPEFAKLSKDKQMALEAKFKIIEMEVSMDLDEKTAGEKEKKMIEGRKKLMKGDPFGAKEDLLAYYNQEGKNPEKDPVRFEQAKEMLKQIAKIELSQMVQRLVAMKASIKDRYNNNAFGKTDYGTQTVGQAQDNIDNMARIIDAAEEMIESGKCVTIEGAEALLKKFEFPPNTVGGVQALDEKAAEIKQKGEDELKKGKEKRLNKEKAEVDRLQNAIKQLESGEIKTTLTGEPVTIEYIQKRKEQLNQQIEKVKKVDGMSLEDERQAELEPVERDLKKAKLDRALKSWKLGFPVDMKSNSWEVFDMFVQQRKLNDPDPKVRKEATLEEARKARERGFTGLARQMYESYFSDDLKLGAKSVDKNAVREKTLKNPDVAKRLDQSLLTWEKDNRNAWTQSFIQSHNGQEPTEEDFKAAKNEVFGKMQSMVVSEAYNKEVKLATYKGMEDTVGSDSDEWKKVYGGTVAIEDFGQGGAFTAFWTDEQWNALPVKVGVFTAVTIASAGVGSAAVAGTGMAARAVLGEAIIGRILATGGGRALAWAGGTAVEGAAFSAAQFEFNGLLMGNGYERFSADYWKAMGHSVVTMGLLKGIGSGVGKLQNSIASKQMAKYLDETGAFTDGAIQSGAALKLLGGGGMISQGIGMATEGAWWVGKTSLEGGAMVGLDAGTAFLSGRHFTAKEAAKSFGENFLFSAAVGGVHTFMGSGAHEGQGEKQKLIEDIEAMDSIGKFTKTSLEVDTARAKLEKAREEGKPTEKLEKDLVDKQFKQQNAEFEMLKAEKAEIEARAKAASQKVFDIQAKIDKLKAKGKTDPKLEAELVAAVLEAGIATRAAADANKIDFSSVASIFTAKDANFEVPAVITEKLMAGEKFNAEDAMNIEKGIAAGKIEALEVISWIKAGKLDISQSTVEAILEAQPYQGLIFAEEKGFKIDAERKQKIFDDLLANDKDFQKARDLVERGLIDIDHPATVDHLLQTPNGKELVYGYVISGRILLTEAIATALIKNPKMAGALYAMFVTDSANDVFIDSGLSKEKLKEAIEREQTMTLDADILHSKAFDLGDKFGESLAASAKRVEAGKPDPNNKMDAALERLKTRDPEGYNILKGSGTTLDVNYIQAIIQGNKIHFTDANGKQVTAYEGNYIAAGGMGTVSHVAYVAEGSNTLQYAVIKRPHNNPNTKEMFDKDRANAKIVSEWDSPYINKALHVGEDVIIFETGKNAGSLWDKLHKSNELSPRDTVKVIIDALKGLAVYQEKGYVHGDLKEANIIVFDGPNGPQAQLIDNSPTPMDQVTSIPFAWTPQYTSPWSRGITHGSPEMFRVWDNTSMGIVIGELIKYKGMTELQPIHDKLVGYDNTSPEALSEAIAALEGILPQMSKLKPGQVVFGNPKDADSNMQTSPAAPIQ